MRKKEEISNPKSCLSHANDNEMLFVILARDPAAQEAILAWVAERIRLGENQMMDEKIQDALEVVKIMEIQRISGMWRLEKK